MVFNLTMECTPQATSLLMNARVLHDTYDGSWLLLKNICTLMSMTIHEFSCVHIVTCKFIIENVYVLLNLTKTNLYIGDFQIMLQSHVIFGFDERCTYPQACPQNTPFYENIESFYVLCDHLKRNSILLRLFLITFTSLLSFSNLRYMSSCFTPISHCRCYLLSLYSLIRDFGKSQNNCKCLNIYFNFLLWWHVFVPIWLVPPMQITLLSHIEYILCFSCSLFEKLHF